MSPYWFIYTTYWTTRQFASLAEAGKFAHNEGDHLLEWGAGEAP